MQQGSGIILIIVGLLVIFIVVTGKYAIFEEFFYKLFNLTPQPSVTDSVTGEVKTVTSQVKTIQDAIDSARRAARLPNITGGIKGNIGILN